MHKRMYTIFGIILALAVTGCASKGGDKPADVVGPTSGAGAQTTGAESGLGPDGRPLSGAVDAAGIPVQRVVYFDFDKSDIRPQDKAVLEAHARYLAANGNAQVRLEGHADERGSREYNLALGEQRAKAARDYLSILGALAGQMSTFSYGEENPLEMGHDEMSWQLNRRVEIVYPGAR